MLHKSAELLTKYKNIIKISISLLFFYVLFVKVINVEELLLAVSGIRYELLILCLFIAIVSLLLRSVRWKYMISQSYTVKYLDLTRLYFIGQYYGSITPGKAGEFIRGYQLQSLTGMTKTEGLISVFFERLYDIVIPIIFIFTAICFKTSLTVTFCITLILGVISIISLYTIYNRFVVKRFRSLQTAAGSVRTIVIASALTIGVWLCYDIIAYIILYSLNQNIVFDLVVFSVFAATLISLVPITIGGWGLREGSYIMLLTSVDPTIAVIFSIIFALLSTYFLGLIGMIIEWLHVGGQREYESDGVKPAKPGH
ncbi:lysylphosphatidylglycerol synthase transmembrane domain-containing protein [Methanocella arvoryzae]|uniref:Flippase-like domain-containing protein n=1 Tax=Methanocella arvoryzae (strain DSM 22066 / NBRC 105507 / MRE50) TaxID=351160 RepID=Q0W7F8_METAR|nr:conserved hypothetical protein [Methanocella arvoryzae MRE50]